ncbi:hypothetical protein Tco_1036122 [Tanacetum coccineum]
MSKGSRLHKSNVNESNITRGVLVDLSTVLSLGENTSPKRAFHTLQDDDTGLVHTNTGNTSEVRCISNATTGEGNQSSLADFEPKAHGISPKNEAPNLSISAKDGPNIVHTSFKEQPAKAVDIPSSSLRCALSLMCRQFDPENYSRSKGDLNVSDDMESEEDVEFVFDETVNLLKSTKMRVNTYMSLDVSKT